MKQLTDLERIVLSKIAGTIIDALEWANYLNAYVANPDNVVISLDGQDRDALLSAYGKL